MTKKEAIDYLKNTEGYTFAGIDNPKHNEAINLAIRALMVYRDCKHCIHNIKLGDMRGCELWDCDFEDMRGEDE